MDRKIELIINSIIFIALLFLNLRISRILIKVRSRLHRLPLNRFSFLFQLRSDCFATLDELYKVQSAEQGKLTLDDVSLSVTLVNHALFIQDCGLDG